MTKASQRDSGVSGPDQTQARCQNSKMSEIMSMATLPAAGLAKAPAGQRPKLIAGTAADVTDDDYILL